MAKSKSKLFVYGKYGTQKWINITQCCTVYSYAFMHSDSKVIPIYKWMSLLDKSFFICSVELACSEFPEICVWIVCLCSYCLYWARKCVHSVFIPFSRQSHKMNSKQNCMEQKHRKHFSVYAVWMNGWKSGLIWIDQIKATEKKSDWIQSIRWKYYRFARFFLFLSSFDNINTNCIP